MTRSSSANQVRKADAVGEQSKRCILLRLRRIEGQVRGLQRMVEKERCCLDVLEQLSAVHESLRGVGQLLLRNHLEHYATNALAAHAMRN
jgi:DNA-binding FrmR family transcriptional regulator